MSHEITVRQDGTAEAVYAGKAAWHGLGTVLENAPTGEAAIRFAQLDWDVLRLPLLAAQGANKPAIPVPDRVANVRADNHLVMGVVSDRYVIIQNLDAFRWVDGLVADGSIRYESAGSLRDGRRIWLLARMPGQIETTPGDVTHQYILFSSSHDGTQAIRVLPTAVRVVCNNTLNLAIGYGEKAEETGEESMTVIRHLGNVERRLEAAREMLNRTSETFRRYGEQTIAMAKMSLADLGIEPRAFFRTVLPDVSGRNNTRRQASRALMMKNYLMMEGPTSPSRNTLWAALNAVTRWVDHQRIYRGQTERQLLENRMEGILTGVGATLKGKALGLATQLLDADGGW